MGGGRCAAVGRDRGASAGVVADLVRQLELDQNLQHYPQPNYLERTEPTAPKEDYFARTGGTGANFHFDEPFDIISRLGAEVEGRREIGLYVAVPHVLISQAPDELFIDPSLTYRLELHRYRPRRNLVPGVFVRRVTAQWCRR